MSGVFVARIYGLQGLEHGGLACAIGDALRAKQPEVTHERVKVTYEAEPAEEWELVTADQVRVGDQIEVIHENPGEESSAVFRGPVTYRAENGRVLHIGIWAVTCTADSDLIPSVTIRRRVRATMPEPDAPAVVRHAGRMFMRPDDELGHGGTPWRIMQGNAPGASDWYPWAAVLVLDPSTDPVPVDLGGGA